MSNIRLGPDEILEYDARFGVLICRQCQYAIQKSAISSHLLRHKIYRGDRQQLLSAIAKLALLDPDKVPLPEPTSSPVESLPVISGYCCSQPECGNLCASSKRMKRHWSDAHDLTETGEVIALALARPAALQTFFRGTKIRYFEVTPASIQGFDDASSENGDDERVSRVSPKANAAAKGGEDDEGDELVRRHDVHDDHDGLAILASFQNPSIPVDILSDQKQDPSAPLDLVTLQYFYHFTSVTHATLPWTSCPRLNPKHWDICAVQQALHSPRLMYGILAISASHLAYLQPDNSDKQIHIQRWKQYETCFMSQECPPDLLEGNNAGLSAIGWQIKSILRCAQLTIPEYVPTAAKPTSSTAPCVVHSMMTAIKDFDFFAGQNPGNYENSPAGTGGNDEAWSQARKLMALTNTRPSSDKSDTTYLNQTPQVVRDVLRFLPARIAGALGEPDNVEDVVAALSAINALVECCEISFSSDDLGTTWHGMSLWLTKVSEHFVRMMLCQDRAAMVVAAYWSTLLVKRTELCGCWFLKNASAMIMHRIVERTPADKNALHDLLKLPWDI